MVSTTVRDIGRLPKGEKRSLEKILRHELEGGQKVFILAFTPGLLPDSVSKSKALAGLEKTWRKVDGHRRKNHITRKEFNMTVDEARKHLRRSDR